MFLQRRFGTDTFQRILFAFLNRSHLLLKCLCSAGFELVPCLLLGVVTKGQDNCSAGNPIHADIYDVGQIKTDPSQCLFEFSEVDVSGASSV